MSCRREAGVVLGFQDKVYKQCSKWGQPGWGQGVLRRSEWGMIEQNTPDQIRHAWPGRDEDQVGTEQGRAKAGPATICPNSGDHPRDAGQSLRDLPGTHAENQRLNASQLFPYADHSSELPGKGLDAYGFCLLKRRKWKEVSIQRETFCFRLKMTGF